MIEKQSFGRTNHISSRIIFNAAIFGMLTQSRADRLMDVLSYYGVNHIDSMASYGSAEARLGNCLKNQRQDIFLATRIKERGYQKAREQFHRSLERLQMEQVDMLQLHNLVEPDEWDAALGTGGALEMAVEAREQGLTRFIGVTGDSITAPMMHKRSLERFDFDAVSLPCNYVMMQHPQYSADFEALAALCRERDVAIQGTAAIARGRWGNKTRIHTTWYEPLESQSAIKQTLHWLLGKLDVFLNTVEDTQLLPKVLEAANSFQAMPSEGAMNRLVIEQKMTPLFETA